MLRRTYSRSVQSFSQRANFTGFSALSTLGWNSTGGFAATSSSSSMAVQRRFQTGTRQGMRTNKDWAGSYFPDQDIAGVTTPQDQEEAKGMEIKPNSTLVDLWDAALLAWPTRRFLGTKMWVRGRLGYVWSTYESLNQEIDAMRHMLANMGLEKGGRICIISDNRYEWFVVQMACMQLGGQFVALPTNITPTEAQRVVKATGCRLLFVETEASYATVKGWVNQVGELKHVLCFEDHAGEASYAVAVTIASDFPKEQYAPRCKSIRNDDTACILFTAGTTGPPKGVMLSHRTLVANISSVHGQFGEALSHEDIFMSLCPWTVAGALTLELYQVLLKGAAMAIPPEIIEGFQDLTTVNPTVVVAPALPFQRAYNNIVDDIVNRKLTKHPTRVVVGAITQSRVMMRKPTFGVRCASSMLLGTFKKQFGTDLRLVVIIGHMLTKDQTELLADLDLFVVNTYGCLEAGGVLATDMDVSTKLKALPGVELRVVNDNNEVVVPGDLGEILVEAPHAMQGYFDLHIDQDEAARSVVIHGHRTFVRTGDFGCLNAGGWITVRGHKDVMITLRDGKVMDPLEIETILCKSPFIKQAFVFGDGRPYLVALIVPLSQAISQHLRKVERRDGVPVVNEREKADCIRSELRRVSQTLPPRSHIRRFAFVDEFTQSNGFITAKMGYARQKIETHYVHYINQLYDETPKFYGFAVDDYDDLF